MTISEMVFDKLKDTDGYDGGGRAADVYNCSLQYKVMNKS